MLMKKPMRSSISERVRLATGEPTATSDWPLIRWSSACQPASSSMNRVTPRSSARRRSAVPTAGGMESGAAPPRKVCTGGRGRSVGISSVAIPLSRSAQ